MKLWLRLTFLALMCGFWLIAHSAPMKAYAYCEEGESGGLYAYFGDCCFIGEIIVNQKCYSVDHDDACYQADMCGEICQEPTLTQSGTCSPYFVGNNEYGYDISCRCYWDLER